MRFRRGALGPTGPVEAMDPLGGLVSGPRPGPTGVTAPGYVGVGETKGVQLFGATGPAGPYRGLWLDGEWYAFRLRRRGVGEDEFFARVRCDPLTGYLELEEIEDPYVCAVCGVGYQQGAHTEFGFAGPYAHDYQPRGA